MITAYKYKLRPTQNQVTQIDEWLELVDEAFFLKEVALNLMQSLPQTLHQ
jgi:hypothetical protein